MLLPEVELMIGNQEETGLIMKKMKRREMSDGIYVLEDIEKEKLIRPLFKERLAGILVSFLVDALENKLLQAETEEEVMAFIKNWVESKYKE
jgi:hypothetical protein